jgi:hypothetical protein
MTFTVDVSDNGSPILSDEREYTLEVLGEPNQTYIKFNSLVSNLEVYPNPSGEYLTVKIPDSGKNMTINILDNKGINVYSSKVSSDLSEIETSGISNGIYYLQVVTGGQVVATHKIEILK